MILRKVIFWCHLVTGLAIGLVVLFMSATGVLLAFQRQIIEFAERDLRRLEIAGSTAGPLAMDDLLARARGSMREKDATAITLRANPQSAVAVSFGRDKTAYLHPVSGAFLGEGAIRTRAFFDRVEMLHRWFGADRESRAIPRAITGAANLGFTFLLISGLILWWPRKWTVKRLAHIASLKRGLAGRARDFNWHNTLGVWSAPILLVLTLTGAVMSYPWASNLLYTLTGSEVPPARVRQPPPAPSRPANQESSNARSGSIPNPAVEPDTALDGRAGLGRVAEPGAMDSHPDLDRLTATAAAHIPDWQALSLRFPDQPDTAVTCIIDRGGKGRPGDRVTLVMDGQSGEIQRVETFTEASMGRRLRIYTRPLHTGEIAGFWGQIIAFLASAAACLLVWSGFSLAWRRFFSKRIARPG